MKVDFNNIKMLNYKIIISLSPSLYSTSTKEPVQCDEVNFGNNVLFNKSSEEIYKILKESATPENILRETIEAKIYKIKDTNYCLKLSDKDGKVENLLCIPDFEVSENEKINLAVAKFGDNGSKILKFIEGTPVMNNRMSSEEQCKVAQQIAQMPVSAYSKLIRQVTNANKHNMQFDTKRVNIIVNSQDKTLTAVSFYELENPEHFNPLSHIYPALINNYATQAQKQAYAGKLLPAAIKELEPYKKPCIAPDDFDFSKFLYLLFNNEIIENKNFITVCLNSFDKIQKSKQTELKGYENSCEINTQIIQAKALIKQLLHVAD